MEQKVIPQHVALARKALDERPLLRVGLFALLLVGMTVAAYAPALEAGFVWDDDDYVTANPLLPAADGLWRIWFTMDAPSQYVPVVYSALRLQYTFFGLEPFGYHLVNVLLQAVNALLVWGLLARLKLPGAWFAAAIFAVHPVHVESVAWVTELKNLLSLLFSLMTLWVWVRFLESGEPTRSKLYGLSLLLYIPALLSKATACTLPAALLLLVWLRDEPIDRRRIGQIAGFVLLGIAMGLTTMYWETVHVGTEGERFSLSPLEALLVASRGCWFYLGKLAWPTSLAFSYPKFEIDPSDTAGWSPGSPCSTHSGMPAIRLAAGRWPRCSSSSPPSPRSWDSFLSSRSGTPTSRITTSMWPASDRLRSSLRWPSRGPGASWVRTSRQAWRCSCSGAWASSPSNKAASTRTGRRSGGTPSPRTPPRGWLMRISDASCWPRIASRSPSSPIAEPWTFDRTPIALISGWQRPS
ncbi:MAG: glycosyltransferase family 39 protein [bacterium]|nr:glycosyltransferase family 39 protein [bacterium]